MNEIAMISIDKLRHHPQNPWKSIGDVTELAESIKAKGILQNLTVVQCPSVLGEYWVVIGNRRLEAAKRAGVKELPCLIRKDKKNKFFYQAEIQDLEAKHSITICSLDRISAMK